MQVTSSVRHVILSSFACLALPYFPTLSHKQHDFPGKNTEQKCVFRYPPRLSVWNISHSTNNSARYHKGTGLCDGLITCPEESYQLSCVLVWDLQNLKNEEAKTRKWVVKVSKRRRRIIKVRKSPSNVPVTVARFNQTWIFSTNIKFHENSSSDSRVLPWAERQTDGQTNG